MHRRCLLCQSSPLSRSCCRTSAVSTRQQSKGISCCLTDNRQLLRVSSTEWWVFSQLRQNCRLSNQHWGTHLLQMSGLVHAAADLRKENEHCVDYRGKDIIFQNRGFNLSLLKSLGGINSHHQACQSMM